MTSAFEPTPRTRIGRLWKAFLNTMAGLDWAVRHERAVQEECLVLAAGVPLSIVFAVSVGWWLALVGSLLLLLIVELLNTAIEKLSDHVTPEHHLGIKVVKDLGSAARCSVRSCWRCSSGRADCGYASAEHKSLTKTLSIFTH